MCIKLDVLSWLVFDVYFAELKSTICSFRVLSDGGYVIGGVEWRCMPRRIRFCAPSWESLRGYDETVVDVVADNEKMLQQQQPNDCY